MKKEFYVVVERDEDGYYIVKCRSCAMLLTRKNTR